MIFQYFETEMKTNTSQLNKIHICHLKIIDKLVNYADNKEIE